jgi:hypothetical protein
MDEQTYLFGMNRRGIPQDPRRRQERNDFNVIREDKTAMANLPRMAQHHEFPAGAGLFDEEDFRQNYGGGVFSKWYKP